MAATGIVINNKDLPDQDFVGLIFTDPHFPLYVMRGSDFKLTPQERKEMSKKQQERALTPPALGETVGFIPGPHDTVLSVRKPEYVYYKTEHTLNDKFTLIVDAVMSPGENKELRCREFGRLRTRVSDLRGLLPNVMYQAYVRLIVHYSEEWLCSPKIDFSKEAVRPKLYTMLMGIGNAVRLDERKDNFIRSMSWNERPLRLVQRRPIGHDDDEMPAFTVEPRPTPGKGSLSNRLLLCIMIDEVNAFCHHHPKEKFKLACPDSYHRTFAPGAVLRYCMAYKCYFNNCYIIYNYIANGPPLFPHEEGNKLDYYPSRPKLDGTGHLLLMPVKMARAINGSTHLYSKFAGRIKDPKKLLLHEMVKWEKEVKADERVNGPKRPKEKVSQQGYIPKAGEKWVPPSFYPWTPEARAKDSDSNDERVPSPVHNAWVYYSPSDDGNSHFAIYELE